MELTKKVPTTDKSQENNHLLRMLDRGIDDMEAGSPFISITLHGLRLKYFSKTGMKLSIFLSSPYSSTIISLVDSY